MNLPLRTLHISALALCWLAATTALAEAERVQLETEDGIVLSARYYAPSGDLRGAVVYIHQPGRSSNDWDYLASKLAEKGIAGLAPDLRGHGDSLRTKDGKEVDRELFDSEDFYAMERDVAASVGYLRNRKKVGTKGVQLVGADVGGSAALLYAVHDTEIDTLALLSPGLMYDSVDTVGKVSAFGARPLLMVVSVEDGYSVKSTDVLAREARGPFHQQTYYGVGHGTKMLNREPELEQLLSAWLMGTFKTSAGLTLAETLKLNAQDKSSGMDDMSDTMAEEQRARAQRERESEESDEKSNKDSQVDGAEDTPTRWD